MEVIPKLAQRKARAHSLYDALDYSRHVSMNGGLLEHDFGVKTFPSRCWESQVVNIWSIFSLRLHPEHRITRTLDHMPSRYMTPTSRGRVSNAGESTMRMSRTHDVYASPKYYIPFSSSLSR